MEVSAGFKAGEVVALKQGQWFIATEGSKSSKNKRRKTGKEREQAFPSLILYASYPPKGGCSIIEP